MFTRNGIEPVGSAEAGFIAAGLIIAGEPIGALPTKLGAENGTGTIKTAIKR